MDLLSLSHGDVTGFKLQPLPQGDDGVSRVGAHRQEADERSSRVGFLPHPLQVQDHTFAVLLTHRARDVFTGLQEKENSIRQRRPSIHFKSPLIKVSGSVGCWSLSCHRVKVR